MHLSSPSSSSSSLTSTTENHYARINSCLPSVSFSGTRICCCSASRRGKTTKTISKSTWDVLQSGNLDGTALCCCLEMILILMLMRWLWNWCWWWFCCCNQRCYSSISLSVQTTILMLGSSNDLVFPCVCLPIQVNRNPTATISTDLDSLKIEILL